MLVQQRRIGTGQKIIESVKSSHFAQPPQSSGERRSYNIKQIYGGSKLRGPAGYTDIVDVVIQNKAGQQLLH